MAKHQDKEYQAIRDDFEGWGQQQLSKPLDDFLMWLRWTDEQYRIMCATELEANDATQDVLHSIELEAHDYHVYARLSKKLREIRQARREAKNYMLTIRAMKEWIDGNQAVIKRLEQVLGAMRKEERRIENCTYTPKTNCLKGREFQTQDTKGGGHGKA